MYVSYHRAYGPVGLPSDPNHAARGRIDAMDSGPKTPQLTTGPGEVHRASLSGV
jgi:hypothetical protein